MVKLAQAIDRGDPIALRVLEETGRYLGIAVANLVNLFNPRTIVLGDFVARQLGEPLLAATSASAAEHAMSDTFRAVTLSLCTLSHNAVSLGAATLALEGFLADREHFGPIAARRSARQRSEV